MIPLNPIMLFGLAAVAIPIIIHILNRRRARVVDWGAMQFLEDSLASRNRRILIEEIILMILRCLLLGLLALALARPFVKTGRLLGSRGDQAQDIAIVLDGSLSMTISDAGRTRFAQAVEEARQVVRAARPGDAIGLVLAGPTATPVLAVPLSDRAAVEAALDALAPAGGSMGVLEALHAATLTLSAGTNPGKKILLITDGQRIGWDLSAEQRWQFLSESARALATEPTIVVRALPRPARWANVAVTGVRLSREVVGTDRPVQVTVTVANTAVGPVTPEGIELLVDGVVIERREGRQIAQGVSVSEVFEHRFAKPGPHVVEGRAAAKDDLPGDDRSRRVVNVLRALPVLVVRGELPAGGSSEVDYLALAMAPPPEEDDDAPARNKPDEGADDYLLVPTEISAADVGKIESFESYPVIVLADAPRLPAKSAAAIARRVADGAGLLIAPGEKAEKAFYNEWKAPDARTLAGVEFADQADAGADDDGRPRPLHIAPNTIDHPALKLLTDPAVSDLGDAQIRRRWLLKPDEDASVSVGARLDAGECVLVQRKCGEGLVLTLSIPLDTSFSNLPSHASFVALVHELVYYLAAPSQRPMNVEPGRQIIYDIPGPFKQGDTAEMTAPDGQRAPAAVRAVQGRWQATYAMTAAPGLYRLVLPAAALVEPRPAVVRKGPGGRGNLKSQIPDPKSAPPAAKASPPATAPAAPATAPDGLGEVPFVVLADPNESTIESMDEAEFAAAGQHVNIARAQTLGELTAAVSASVPGREIWQIVALIAAGLLVLEIAVTRYIAASRQVHLSEPVAFGATQVDVESFRQAAGGARKAAAKEAV